jgi:molybdopterin converting factor subunit 1
MDEGVSEVGESERVSGEREKEEEKDEKEDIAVTVRLFAMLRESAGTGSMELRLPLGSTVEDALGVLAQDPPLRELVRRLPLRAAVNREYADAGTVLSPGDELALIPPVSGGAQDGGEGIRTHALVTSEPLSSERLRRMVDDPGAGAVVIFEGVTREVPALEYEAYVEMAQARIEEILKRCVARHGLRAAVAEHRTGRVGLGEASVIVAVSAGHREEAFAGAREAIDEIKTQAPIWKREERGEGEGGWVEGSMPRLHEEEDVRDEASEAGLRRHGG